MKATDFVTAWHCPKCKLLKGRHKDGSTVILRFSEDEQCQEQPQEISLGELARRMLERP